ncbi:MAG: sensor domain-containing protein [Mycobacterium sp.]|nr:sensor domain-containing protein [Mycobacterium sp.]
MTTPPGPPGENPYGHHPFAYDPLGRVPPPVPPPGPPVFAPAPETSPYPPPVNTLATLSLVFAFLFAPVGAVLGHLAMRQIGRTGERGRDRALVGTALSYGFIMLAVFALVAWATLAASTPDRAAAPVTTSGAAPPPTVAPGAIAALLPGRSDLENITGDQNLRAGQIWDHPARSDREGTIDRPECWGSIAPGTPDAYTVDAIFGYRAAEFSDTRSLLKSVQIIEAVAAFRDPAAAESQLAALLAQWHRCGGSTVQVAIPGGQAIPFALGVPVDAGGGITTMDLAPRGLRVRSVRALAAKANVIVDLYLSYSGTTDSQLPRQPAVGIADYILGKIPG